MPLPALSNAQISQEGALLPFYLLQQVLLSPPPAKDSPEGDPGSSKLLWQIPGKGRSGEGLGCRRLGDPRAQLLGALGSSAPAVGGATKQPGSNQGAAGAWRPRQGQGGGALRTGGSGAHGLFRGTPRGRAEPRSRPACRPPSAPWTRASPPRPLRFSAAPTGRQESSAPPPSS